MNENSENPVDCPYSFSETDVEVCFGNLIAAIYAAGDLLATLDINNIDTLEDNITEKALEHYKELLQYAVEDFETAREIFGEIEDDAFAAANNSHYKEWEVQDGCVVETKPEPPPERPSRFSKANDEDFDEFSDF